LEKRNPIILIHGLWNTSSIFSSIIKKLDDIGIEYFAPTLKHSYGMTSIIDLTNSLNELILEKYGFKKFFDNKFEICLTGLAGFLATLSWFFAFTLIQASFVRAVGQIEIFFSYISSKYLFKEKITFIEILGILIFIAGATLLLLTRAT